MTIKTNYKPIQLERLEKMNATEREALDLYQLNELITAAANNLASEYRKSGGTDYHYSVNMIEQALLESAEKIGGKVGKFLIGIGESTARQASTIFIDESIT